MGGGGTWRVAPLVFYFRPGFSHRAMLCTSLERRRRSPSSCRYLTSVSFAARMAPAKAAPSQARIRCASSTTGARSKERRFPSPQYVGDGVGMDDCGRAASAGIHLPVLRRACCCWRRKKVNLLSVIYFFLVRIRRHRVDQRRERAPLQPDSYPD